VTVADERAPGTVLRTQRPHCGDVGRDGLAGFTQAGLERIAQRFVKGNAHQSATVAHRWLGDDDRHRQDAPMLQQVFAEIKHAIAGVGQAHRQPLGEAARADEADGAQQGAKSVLAWAFVGEHGHGSAATMRFCARRPVPALA
jgi:hypothetical protein